jgi:ribosomal protein S18 acetylase RimI-like enzyme
VARDGEVDQVERPFKIRKARPDDVQQVHDVHSVAIRTGAASAYDPEVVEVWVDAFNPENFPANIERMEFYVVELQGGRIGAFLAFDPNTAEIDSVYVAPWGGGLGLGSFLLGFAEEKGRLAGLDTMWLDASLNAVSFYQKYGWVEMERHARIRKGIEISVVKMEKMLGS